MGLIEDFLLRYRKEYDFYDQAGRLVAQTIDGSLQAAGVRSIVTSRAKSVGRIEMKTRQRMERKQYSSVDDIYRDIVDLAGVRVALYFPGEREPVDRIIKDLFVLTEDPKQFPTPTKATYTKRFSGYWATHYRVQLRDAALSDAQKRYADARVEVQVASVLMHAWAEVEHDLVYKPLQGKLSDDEYAILDELNGLVMAGEIALERLQNAGEARVAAGEREFSNHYDLASHLFSAAGPKVKGPAADTALGRVDLLFDLLSRLALATPNRLRPYIDALHGDTERRPFAEQIIDQLLAEDESRYKTYEEVRVGRPAPGDFGTSPRDVLEPELHETIGLFLASWVEFEKVVRQRARRLMGTERAPTLQTYRTLVKYGLLDADLQQEVDFIRRIRNDVVHGADTKDPATLREAAARIQRITARLRNAPEIS